MEDNLLISANERSYEIDNNVSDIKILITYIDGFNYQTYKVENELNDGRKLTNFHIVYDDFNIFDAYKIMKNDLKDNKIKIYDYNDISVKVISNEENINRLKQNYDMYYEEDIY